MQNILLQLDTGRIQDSLDNTVNTLIEQITPELPHTSFVTDLAFIMIIGAIITLAFFKIKQPLIIGYLCRNVNWPTFPYMVLDIA